MTIDATTLLKQLGSSGRLGGVAPGQSASPKNAVESSSFADLLKQVRDGALRAGEPVEIEPGCGVKLCDEDLAKVSLAADRAEAEGVRTALVLVGDQRLLLDVSSRKILGPAGSQSGITAGVDGVIDLRSGANANASSGIAGASSTLSPRALGAGIASHPDVLRALMQSA